MQAKISKMTIFEIVCHYELGEVCFTAYADFYGEAFYNKYISVIEMQPGYEKLLDELKIKWILFPAYANLITDLKASGLWHQVASDSASCLLIRSRTGAPYI